MQQISIHTTVNGPVSTVWEYWTGPEHIMKWCNASPDWHAPSSQNDLKPGGKFKTTMAARDGSVSFDFSGTYDDVRENELITYTLDDGRKVSITFAEENNRTLITESFEPEEQNPIDLQRDGWQAILENFKAYAEEMQLK